MGEVWKARDTTLHRDVAIKTLPVEFALDSDRLARFQREATLLASLNHPNIASIHGLEEHHGTRFLVLELVEGGTLADRLGRGPIPVDESLKLALQMAEALEAAHEKGVIHRDLKPANIKVTPEGRVKVLDFGLSKALEPAAADAPTLTAIATQAGAVIGTPAYMSPEQARGDVAGRQADIWSFGVVLYEMLTGASPFARRSTAETLASVLGPPPDYAALPSDTPAAPGIWSAGVSRRIRSVGCNTWETCGSRSKRRWPCQWVKRRPVQQMPRSQSDDGGAPPRRWRWPVSPESPDGGSPSVPQRRRLPQWSVCCSPRWNLRAPIRLDSNTWRFQGTNPASPLHRRVGSGFAGWVTRRPSPSRIRASNPFFSPNGEWVGFFNPGVGLAKAPSVGGTPVSIAATTQRPAGATWRADGTIVFATTEGLYQVSETWGRTATSRETGSRAERTSVCVAAVHARRPVRVVHGGAGRSGRRIAGCAARFEHPRIPHRFAGRERRTLRVHRLEARAHPAVRGALPDAAARGGRAAAGRHQHGHR